jgi:hypothetical protein
MTNGGIIEGDTSSSDLSPTTTFTFGSGDCSFANASEGFKGWGADEVAPPRS